MSVIEKAKELAEELSKDEIILELHKAREAYMHNEPLAELAKEYMVQSAALQEEMNKGESADKDTVVAIKDRMMQLAAELNKSEDIINLRNAEENANELLAEVNKLLESAISGVDPDAEENCTHDCSHCHGCH